MDSPERQHLMSKENNSAAQRCFRWMSKPLNRYGIGGVVTGVMLVTLSVLLPEDGLTADSPGYMFMCLIGLLLIGASSGLIIRQRGEVTLLGSNSNAVANPSDAIPSSVL